MHPSTFEKGEMPKCKIVSPSVFGCPLCPRFITKSSSVIQRHLLNHEANAVHFKEQVICRCNLPCRGRSHFHCPFCEKTIIRKAAIATHLIDCQTKCDTVQLTWDPPPHPPSPETHPVVLSLYMEHSYLLLPSVAAVKIDHSYIQTAPLKTPAVATDIKEEPEDPADPVKLEKPEGPAEPEGPEDLEDPDLSLSPTAIKSEDPISPEKEMTGKYPPTHVKCPHCPLVLDKKNLLIHIQRKHSRVKRRRSRSHSKCTTSTKVAACENGIEGIQGASASATATCDEM